VVIQIYGYPLRRLVGRSVDAAAGRDGDWDALFVRRVCRVESRRATAPLGLELFVFLREIVFL
jgi:hypothetical protein